ncbi:MAG TPA: hypothetical protein VFE07_10050, partial [Marmoricola sp.]|nr:hypothetical protein [Marmoricola sp.]
MIALLSALVTACALLIPLQQRAIDQASAHVELDRAPDSARVLQLSSSTNLSNYYLGGGQPGLALTPGQLDEETPVRIRQAFGRPVDGQYVDLTMPPTSPRAANGELAWRDGACAHLEMVNGRCPSGAREIAVSVADARNFDWAVGAVLKVEEVMPEGAPEAPVGMALRVVGTYAVPPATYWETWTLTGRSGTKPDPAGGVLHDLWVTDRATFMGAKTWRYPTTRVDLRLRPDVTGVDELLTLADRVAAHARSQSKRSQNSAIVKVRSGLPDVAATVRKAQHQARVTIPALM